jgi:hypothetical protein
VTLTVERDGSALSLPVVEGPSPCPPPDLPPPRPHEEAAEADPRLGGGRSMSPPDPPTRWRVVTDVLGHRIEWPEATVATSARLDLRGDAEAFEVRLDLEAREGGELRWSPELAAPDPPAARLSSEGSPE